jgi:hypothetical protein
VLTATRDARFQGRILPLQVDAAQPAEIAHELGELQLLNLQGAADPGEVLYQFLTGRETALRAK